MHVILEELTILIREPYTVTGWLIKFRHTVGLPRMISNDFADRQRECTALVLTFLVLLELRHHAGKVVSGT